MRIRGGYPTNQYWSGSDNAGPEYLTSSILGAFEKHLGGSANAEPEDLTSVAVDLTVSVGGVKLSESQEEDPGVTLSVEPQYQQYYPGQQTPVFTATSSPADCTVTLNWDNTSDVLVQSTGGATLSSGQQIPTGSFSFYAYATPAFTSGHVDFSVTAKPPTGGSLQDP